MQRPPPRRTAPPGRRALTLAASSVLLLVMGRADVSGQSAAIMPPTPRPAVPLPALEASPPTLALLPEAVGTPHLSWDTPTEIWLLSYPLKLSVTRALVAEPVRLLPPSGLHAGDIRWSFDRGYVGTADPAAGRASSHARTAAVLLPVVVSTLLARRSHRLRDMVVSGAVYGEALLLASAATQLGKTMIGRPRPGAYGPQPVSTTTDAPGPGMFHSMPSSHASIAWTGASVGLATHLLLRPDAEWAERVGLGFVGGALAGVTSALRVRAGAHFPSDVVVGAGIGIASGVVVPLAHRGGRRSPSREAWLQTILGTTAGTVAGVLLAGL